MSEKTTLPGTSVPLFAKAYLSVLEDTSLSPWARLLHARLTFYAGKDGVCRPGHQALSKSLGLSERGIRRALAELKKRGLVSWIQTESTCSYTMYIPESNTRTSLTAQPGHRCPVTPDTTVLQKDVLKEGLKDVDLRLPIPIGTGVRKPPKSTPKIFPRICEALDRYGISDDGSKIINCAVELMEKAESNDENETDVAKWLGRIWKNRGIKPGTKYAPYSLDWFPVLLQERYDKIEDHRGSANPEAYDGWYERNLTRGVI